MLTVVLDMQNLREKDKNEWVRRLPIPGLETLLTRVLAVGLKAEEGKSLLGSATLICRDANGAVDARKVVDDNLAALKTTLADPKIPAEMKMVKEAQKFLDAVKVSAAGNKVSVEASVEPVLAVQMLQGFFMPTNERRPDR